MTAEIFSLPGCESPPKAKPAPAEPSFIEPAVAPLFVSNVRPRVTVNGGLATIICAALEQEIDGQGVSAVIQAKICVPAYMLPQFSLALAAACDSGHGTPENDGRAGGKDD